MYLQGHNIPKVKITRRQSERMLNVMAGFLFFNKKIQLNVCQFVSLNSYLSHRMIKLTYITSSV